MTVTISLSAEMERRLCEQASKRGLRVGNYVLEREMPANAVTARGLLALPTDERARFMAAAAEDAAPLYEADLALPAAERELTAFTALDGEESHDGDA